jgi:hypothetical protein
LTNTGTGIQSADKQIKLQGRADFKLNMGNVNKLAIKQTQSKVDGEQPMASIPKLDLRTVKTEGTTDHRDWYSYAVKLEDSVKY